MGPLCELCVCVAYGVVCLAKLILVHHIVNVYCPSCVCVCVCVTKCTSSSTRLLPQLATNSFYEEDIQEMADDGEREPIEETGARGEELVPSQEDSPKVPPSRPPPAKEKRTGYDRQ